MIRSLLQKLNVVGIGLASRGRNVFYRLLGVRIAGYAWLRRISVPRQWEDITIEEGAALDDGVVLLCSGERCQSKICIGAGSYINRHTIIDASLEIQIGRKCLIGPFCYLTDHDHGQKLGEAMASQPLKSARVRIGNNVWLGAGVIILKGVTIGDDSVVGAGAVVTRDLPVASRAMGVPARKLSDSADRSAKLA